MYTIPASRSSASSAMVSPAILASIHILPLPPPAATCAAAQRSEPTSVPPLVFVTVTVTHSPARADAFGAGGDGFPGATGSSAQAPSAARPRRLTACRQRRAPRMYDGMFAIPPVMDGGCGLL